MYNVHGQVSKVNCSKCVITLTESSLMIAQQNQSVAQPLGLITSPASPCHNKDKLLRELSIQHALSHV